MPYKITRQEADRFASGEITARDIAVKHKLALSTVYRQLHTYAPKLAMQRLTLEERETLKEELAKAIPYDKHYSVKAILARWGVPSLSQALSLIKCRDMYEVQSKPDELKLLFKKYHLKLVKNILYCTKNRGRYKPKKQMHLTPDEIDQLFTTPALFAEQHITEILDMT